MYCRPGTTDERIVKSVMVDNCYRFPENMKGMNVVDIGAHIGAVVSLCSKRGARVVAYEPESGNLSQLLLNLDSRMKKRFTVVGKAIGNPGVRRLYRKQNSGAHSLFTPTDNFEEVEVLPLSDFLNYFPYCDFLKMDCEGAEVEIIPQIIELRDKIGCIVGEIHEGIGMDEQLRILMGELGKYYLHEKIGPYDHKWVKIGH